MKWKDVVEWGVWVWSERMCVREGYVKWEDVVVGVWSEEDVCGVRGGVEWRV